MTAPGLACVTGGHLWMDIYVGDARSGSWCLWCGTGIHDPDRITDDGQVIGPYQPAYALNIPDRFTRHREDA